ncbi:putative F-box domain-containing protein [Medicago truncatula]|uniref:F-box protein interaction domain protein n=2 Tax=Medicago truncatula TaxID=3880 RepID=G7JKT9_MEDTR|nr:F-box protein interaction domain protein [Medicago truncatula]RHN59487.1 putative F-box domain-containing protein [Medicago truncatula]
MQRQYQPDLASQLILPDELIIEIMTWLPVKPLMQFKCVNKIFKTRISNPDFVQMHLNKSSQNPHLALMWKHDFHSRTFEQFSVITFPISLLLQNMYTRLHFFRPNFDSPQWLGRDENTTLRCNPYYRLDENYHTWWVVGSCNGLLCLIDVQCSGYNDWPREYYWLYLWNPATRTKSRRTSLSFPSNFKFSFGYDISSKTYKVVAFRVDLDKERGNATSVVKVFNMADNSRRNIQCFPVLPLYWFKREKNNGVYLSGTINWMTLRDYFYSDYEIGNVSSITVEQYVIVSLDLSTESYTELLLPRGFDEVSCVQPTLVVLINCLCFCHDFKGSHLVLWKMTDFGVQESWIQLFKISYENFHSSEYLLKFETMELLPLYLSKNAETLIFANDENDTTFIYNCRDNRGEQIRITNKIWWLWAKDYVESLVPTR